MEWKKNGINTLKCDKKSLIKKIYFSKKVEKFISLEEKYWKKNIIFFSII